MKISGIKEVCSGCDSYEDNLMEFFYLLRRSPQNKMEDED